MASPYSHLRRRAHFSPSSIMLCAVEVVWFVAEPQGTPVPQTTLKPSLVIEPQQTLLPQTTDVPVTKETLCVVGSKTAVGDAVEPSAKSLLDSASAISR